MTIHPVTTESWEKICRQCGGCCFEKKLDSRGNILTTNVPCRFLDVHTRLCRVYHQRQLAMDDCLKLTPENLAELDWLPEDCAYREVNRNPE